MNPVSTVPTLPADAEAPPAHGYSAFVRGWLWLDLAFCLLRGLLVIATWMALRSSSLDEGDYVIGLMELWLGVGVAAFGIPGYALLLRRHRLGIVLAGVSLLVVVLALLATYWVMFQKLAHPEEMTCPTWTLVGGVIFGTLLRGGLGLVSFIVLRRAARSLRESTGRSG